MTRGTPPFADQREMDSIETPYNGILFESLLEARWAVFFDHAGIPYEYEYNGFKLGALGKTWYLPDFWLPEQRSWVEVKPYSEFSARDAKKMKHFEQALENEPPIDMGHDLASKHFFIFVGSPYFNGQRHAYKVFFVVPNPETALKYLEEPPPVSEMEIAEARVRWAECPLCHHLQVGRFTQLRDVNNVVIQERLDCEYCCRFKPRLGERKRQDGHITGCSENYYVYTTRRGYILGSPQLMKGYTAARRFKAPRRRS